MLFRLIENLQLRYYADTGNALRAFCRLEDAGREKVLMDMRRKLPEEAWDALARDPEPCFAELMRTDAIFRAIFYARCRKQSRTDGALYDCVRRSMLHLPADPTIILNSDNIGGGLLIFHGPSGIGEHVRAGSGLTLSLNSYIGKRHRLSPVLGDNVHVHMNASILGPVTVGDNAVIGADSLVLKDVPADTVVAGIPARVLHPVTGRETSLPER